MLTWTRICEKCKVEFPQAQFPGFRFCPYCAKALRAAKKNAGYFDIPIYNPYAFNDVVDHFIESLNGISGPR